MGSSTRESGWAPLVFVGMLLILWGWEVEKPFTTEDTESTENGHGDFGFGWGMEKSDWGLPSFLRVSN